MELPKQLLKINLEFAEKISQILNQPIDNILFDYTMLYRCFNIGRKFNINNPFWQSFLVDFKKSSNKLDLIYEVHLARQKLPLIDGINFTFGCFSFERNTGEEIRIHFNNNEVREYGPLQVSRKEFRKSELKALFSYVKKNVYKPTNVIGRSWLYNIEAYKRLFPKSYLSSVKVVSPNKAYPRISLWGQFLNHRNQIKHKLIEIFLSQLKSQNTIDKLYECFPFKVLRLKSPIQNFYEFYSID